MTRTVRALAAALLVAFGGCGGNAGECGTGYTRGPLGTCVVDERQVPCACAGTVSFLCCRRNEARGQTDGCVGDPVCTGDVLVRPEGSFVHVAGGDGWPLPESSERGRPPSTRIAAGHSLRGR